VTVLTEAYLEGGFRNIWKVLNENSGGAGLVISIISLIITILQVSGSLTTAHDEEEQLLRIQNYKMDLKLKEAKLSKILGKDYKLSSITEDKIISVAKNLKITKAKSKFYSQLKDYDKVTKISLNSLDSDLKPIFDEKFIERECFPEFILPDDKLPNIVDEEASIEIISHVLTQGKYKWKGNYAENVISFTMKDIGFKADVFQKKVPFRNGTTIKCQLEIFRKLNDSGDIVPYSYTVTDVFEVVENESTVKVIKKRKKQKEDDNPNQLLFSF